MNRSADFSVYLEIIQDGDQYFVDLRQTQSADRTYTITRTACPNEAAARELFNTLMRKHVTPRW